MPHRTLAPVFTGLRAGLHALFLGLLALVVVRIFWTGGSPAALALAAALALIYAAGLWVARARHRAAGIGWIGALTLVWAPLVWLVPEAAYLVFPLFFLFLHLLPGWVGPAAVIASTGATIGAFALHGGLTVGGVVGPLVGAGVALLIGLGYGALQRRSVEREALVAELLATRDRLAATEREQGVLAERARLAREIHDTVAQGLSSIQLLLHAAERADATGPGVTHIRLARQAAADGLAETRRFIRELAPPTLDHGLAPALHRLAESWAEREGIDVDASLPDVSLSMDAQTALLRIAQGALANVAQHAGAAHVRIALAQAEADVRLTIADDGRGFDPTALGGAASATDSFGLRAMRERAEQLDGDLSIDSAPGVGTVVAVRVRGALP